MNRVIEEDGPWRDPILAEVRAVRMALFAASGYDIRAFCRRLREEQALSGHVIVTRVSRSAEAPTQPDPDSQLSRRAG